jgi:hypothetical protein
MLSLEAARGCKGAALFIVLLPVWKNPFRTAALSGVLQHCLPLYAANLRNPLRHVP